MTDTQAQAPTATPAASPVVTESVTTPITATPTPSTVAPVVEAPKETPKEIEIPKKTEEELKFASRFAAMAKKERELQAREKALKEEAAKYSDYERAVKEAKQNPVAFMEKHGLTYKEVTDFILNDRKLSPEAQIKQMRDQMEADKKERLDAEQKRQAEWIENTYRQHKAEIRTYCDKATDACELIRASESYDAVFEVIEAYYQKTGQVLPIDKAASEVENHLEAEGRKLLALKKFQPKVVEPPKEPLPATTETSEDTNDLSVKTSPTTVSTLTNKGAQTGTPVPSTKPKTVEDLRRDAMKILEDGWKKKQGVGSTVTA